MANNEGKGVIFTTKFYKISNGAALLTPNKRNPEGKSELHMKGKTAKNQKKFTIKKLVTSKIHANDLHVNIVHTG